MPPYATRRNSFASKELRLSSYAVPFPQPSSISMGRIIGVRLVLL